MRRSDSKVLTTHVGSLPDVDEPDAPGARPASAPTGGGAADGEADQWLKRSVAAVLARQREIGLDIVNDGEYAKGGDWLSYVDERFGGFEECPPSDGVPVILRGKDRETFADFYRYAAERGTLFYAPGNRIRQRRPNWLCTGPIVYRGSAELRHELALLRELRDGNDMFITSTAPASLEPYRQNGYYRTEEEFIYALAEAMRTEYEAITAAGFVLQVDDAWLPALWDRIGIGMGLDAFRRRCLLRVEALNHALANIPEEQIRYHLCWGSWHGPHVYDIEMTHMVDIMLKVKAQAYLFEAANVRHEHEYAVWDQVKLPPGKILVPGVVTHSTDVVEHPDLVAQRIQRFARRVGRENVIAGTDCGFGGRCHPQIAWAKLQALVEGAARASRALGYH